MKKILSLALSLAVVVGAFAVFFTPLTASAATTTAATYSGRILKDPAMTGQFWYVFPGNHKRYSLINTDQQVLLMLRNLALGVSNKNFNLIQNNPTKYSWLRGRLFLKVEDAGKAYYFSPVTKKLVYLGAPKNAFIVLTKEALAINQTNLAKIKISDLKEYSAKPLSAQKLDLSLKIKNPILKNKLNFVPRKLAAKTLILKHPILLKKIK
jgi:hypothetical protein